MAGQSRLDGSVRRFASIVLFSVSVFAAVSGCAKVSEGAENDTDTQQIMEVKTDFDAYEAVMNGKEQFLYFADGEDKAQSMNLMGVLDVFPPVGSAYKEIAGFAVVDLDGDGEQEVVLQITDVGADGGGFLILRCKDEQIHGYTANYKTFSELKTDGTFAYISLARPDDGLGTIRFREKGYDMIPFACSKTSYDLKTVTYQKGQKRISEEAYLDLKKQHQAKTDVVWHPWNQDIF